MYQTILHDFDMRMLMDSGQVFRICCCGENTYAVASGRHLVRIRQTACGPSKEGTLSAFGMSGEGVSVEFSCSPQEFDSYWYNYFDLSTDYGAMKKAVDPKDSFLTSAISYGGGIRILRQDLWETILCFLISQNNNITRIRNSVDALCRRYGERLEPEGFLTGEESLSERDFYSFPDRKKLPPEVWKGCRGWGLAIGTNIFSPWPNGAATAAEKNSSIPCRMRIMKRLLLFLPGNSGLDARWLTASACLPYIISALFRWIRM